MTELVLSEDILSLQEQICARMSEKRFLHSVGVAKYAYKMAKDAKVHNPLDYYIAGLLHDVAKEIPKEEQLAIMKMPSEVYQFCEEDVLSPTLYHGFCAPYIVLRDFPQYAKRDILFAICYHTVGREDMTFFEKVIFLADYIEPTRTHEVCISTRKKFYDRLSGGEDKLVVLYDTMAATLNGTIDYLNKKNAFIDEDTINAGQYFFCLKSEASELKCEESNE